MRWQITDFKLTAHRGGKPFCYCGDQYHESSRQFPWMWIPKSRLPSTPSRSVIQPFSGSLTKYYERFICNCVTSLLKLMYTDNLQMLVPVYSLQPQLLCKNPAKKGMAYLRVFLVIVISAWLLAACTQATWIDIISQGMLYHIFTVPHWELGQLQFTRFYFGIIHTYTLRGLGTFQFQFIVLPVFDIWHIYLQGKY